MSESNGHGKIGPHEQPPFHPLGDAPADTLTFREYLAGQALQGFLSSRSLSAMDIDFDTLGKACWLAASAVVQWQPGVK